MKKIFIFVVLILILSITAFSLGIKPKSPVNKAENVDIRNIFRWEVDEEGDFNFNLYLSTDPKIEDNDLVISNLFSNFYAGNILKPDTQYYWQVEVIDSNKKYKSDVFEFKTRPLEDGDIFEIVYGDYEQLKIYDDYYLGIKSTSIDILNKSKEVVKTIKLDNSFSKISFYKDKALILDSQGTLYLLNKTDLQKIDYEDVFLDIQNNVLLSKKALYYYDSKLNEIFENDGIQKIKSIGNQLFLIYKDKIQKFNEDLSLLKEKEEQNILNIFSFGNGYLLLKNEKIIYIDKDFKTINELKFNVNFEKLNRKIQTSDGYIYILSGKDILSIYNKNLEMVKSFNLDFKTDYIISDKENFVLIGESIKSQNINGDTFWSYGTLNKMEIFSEPVINNDSFSIGVSDYLKRHLFFYNDFSNNVNKDYTISDQMFLKKNEMTTPETTTNIEPTKESTTTTTATEITKKENITVEATVNNIKPTDLSTITTTPEELLNEEVTPEPTKTTSASTLTNKESLTVESTKTNNEKIEEITNESTKTTPESTTNITDESTITEVFNIFDGIKEITEQATDFLKPGKEITEPTEESTQITNESTEITKASTESTMNINFDFEKYEQYASYIEDIYNGFKKDLNGIFTEQVPKEITKVFEGKNDIYVYDINIDKSSTDTAIYLTGYQDDGEWNNLIYKLNEKLDLTKSKIFGGNKTDFLKKSLITKDASNNTVLISVGDTTSEGLNGDISIISLDATLNENYSMNYGDLGRDSGIYIDDYDGENYIVMGNLYVNNKLTDIFLSKYTNNGARLWTSNFGGKSIEIAKDFSVGNQQNIFALGSTRSFGYGGFDIYIVKMDFYGNEIWSNTFGTSVNDLPVGIQNISNNRFLVAYQAERDNYFENKFMIINSEGNIIKQFSSNSDGYEKFLGMKEYKNEIYLYGFKRIGNKTNGIIYKVDMDNGDLIKLFEINRDVNFEVHSIDFDNDNIYIAGNEYNNNEKNKIVIMKRQLKGDK